MNYNICNEERNINLISNIEAMLALCREINCTSEKEMNETIMHFFNKRFGSFFPTLGKKDDIKKEYFSGLEDDASMYFLDSEGLCEPREWLQEEAERIFPTDSIRPFPKYYIPCVTEEVLYLKYFMDEGYLNYFLSPIEVESISKKINTFISNCGIDAETESEKMREFIVMKGRSNLRENWNEETTKQYQRNQKVILTAIDKKQAIEYSLNGQKKVIYPIAIVYSQLEERLRVKGYLPGETRYEREYLSEMSDISLRTDIEVDFPKEKECTILLAVKNKDNAKERLYSRLMEYQVVHLKDFRTNREEDISFVLLTYPEIDHKRISNRLMDVMANVRVVNEIAILSALRRRNVKLLHSWPNDLGTDIVSEDGSKMKNELLDIVKKRIAQEEKVINEYNK